MKLIARIMGFSFAIKLMESGEVMAGETYERLMEEVPEAKRIMEDEERHEQELIDLLNARNRPFRR